MLRNRELYNNGTEGRPEKLMEAQNKIGLLCSEAQNIPIIYVYPSNVFFSVRFMAEAPFRASTAPA